MDRLRAAMRLIENHKAVVRFAARGCGAEGWRPVSAPLSDPSAKPGEPYLPDVDAGAPSPGKTILAPPCAQCAGISCWISYSVDGGCGADGLLSCCPSVTTLSSPRRINLFVHSGSRPK